MDNELNHLNMSRVMDRLTKAGWVSKSMVSPKENRIVWTRRGALRVRQIAKVMIELGWPRLPSADWQLISELVAALRLLPK